MVIKPFMVKNHMRIFVNAKIDNPTFDSQVPAHAAAPGILSLAPRPKS